MTTTIMATGRRVPRDRLMCHIRHATPCTGARGISAGRDTCDRFCPHTAVTDDRFQVIDPPHAGAQARERTKQPQPVIRHARSQAGHP